MALLAESLVEEWLNRRGFFTIRGVKHGNGEVDLLAVRLTESRTVEGRHVEVQASFRPIGYIAPLTSDLCKDLGAGSRSARKRTNEQIDTCARQWVTNKFKAHDKEKLRNSLWPGVKWSFHLVHAVVREERELEIFRQEGVACYPFADLLSDLATSGQAFSGSAGGDLAEIVTYYKSHASTARSAGALQPLRSEQK